MFRRVTTTAVAVTTALLACSPTFDWQEVRVESTGLKALFPCKPDHATRSVAVAGRLVSLQALACDAARGRQVFQAVVYAEALRPEFTDPFFSGLAFE